MTHYSTSERPFETLFSQRFVHLRTFKSPKDCAGIHHTDELIFPLEIIARNIWPLYYNKGIYEPSISQPHYEISLKIWNQLPRHREGEEGKERGWEREIERERKREREEREKWQGRDVGVVFCFFATGYIYNYLAGIKWPRGFFNKGRRHLQYRILPTDQHRTRERTANRIWQSQSTKYII